MIPVTKPFLPPRGEYDEILTQIWDRNFLTNNGPVLRNLEHRIAEYVQVPDVLMVTNGTIAIQLAIKSLDLKGEIITTPFSYVATTSSIVWESCIPTFVDIDPNTFNIDPIRIEAAITEKTTGILATHVFGYPCEVEAISAIARKYGLKVIYDAAHAFGVRLNGKSIFTYGDVSTCSFHATKLFHSVEGGAVFTSDGDLRQKLWHMRNFGHDGPEKFSELGINAKNSEFHAAMGLVNLKYVDAIIEKRKEISDLYDELLEGCHLERPIIKEDLFYNGAYYPVLFESETQLLKVIKALEKREILGRRYFYPSLDELPYLHASNHNLEITKSVASRIYCLPLYYDLTPREVQLISSTIRDALAV